MDMFLEFLSLADIFHLHTVYPEVLLFLLLIL